ncbi:MAG: thioredoxin-disulfide reductase [Paludibacteraceae bacterium]|nr:thioredoxin-disulfide reductase [Paludibacteraceae bacterium]
MEHIRCLIIGSGPAGYTAAIYASRANLQPIVYEGPQAGGQLTTTTEVENFPGYPDGVEPFQMMDDMRRQAERFGAEIRSGIVTKVDFGTTPKRVWIEDTQELLADAVIVATGASARYLGLPSENEYKGRGVSACATCDGFFYRRKTVAVVGGGDTACEEASYLAGLCKKVYLIVRKPYLRASEIMQKRVMDTPNIEVLFEHNTLRLTGEGKVQGADLVYRKGEAGEREVHIDIDGFFLAIGHHPNSDLFKDWLQRDEQGYILTQPGTPLTNVPGVFAAGDVADPHYRQAVTAAASGCKAAIEAEKWLKTL